MVTTSTVRQRQAPLIRTYRDDPDEAVIAKQARTVPAPQRDAFHTSVTIDGPYPTDVWHLGIDHKVGGHHDLPNPGEMLLAALASCHESTLRMVADNLEVTIDSLEVVAHGTVDVRGCLAMDDAVPVGFETIDLETHLELDPATDPHRVELLKGLAERLCVTADTLRRGAELKVSYPT